MENLGKELLGILTHSVGYPKFYRNGFCAGISSKDYKNCIVLVGLGLMKYGFVINDGTSQYFHVTDPGVSFLKQLKKDKRNVAL